MRCISTVIIERPVKEVWDYFDNPVNLSKWLTDFVKFQPINNKQGEIGATAKHIYHTNGRVVELIEEITDRVDYEYFKGKLTHPSMQSIMEVIFTDLGNNRTKLMSISDIQFKSFAFRLFSAFLRRGFQQRQTNDLEKLKQLVEDL